ncbi:MAG TPA: hypothetical protein VJ306_06915, partial [Pyrinomonadaceae bacterium]|nr:hypothetical protein [Pyrinomonadaceae bacterium]
MRKIFHAKAQRRNEIRLESGRLCAVAPLREKTLSLLCVFALLTAQVAAQTASITVDARKIENRINPLLYGQFMEFMFEGIKGGLHAELIRNRSFEETANIIGLSRNWDRYPDDRNDDYALSFAWDDQSS